LSTILAKYTRLQTLAQYDNSNKKLDMSSYFI